MLCINQLVHNNHLTEAEASTSVAILFGWIVVVPLKAEALTSESFYLTDSINLY